jgi:protein gp37
MADNSKIEWTDASWNPVTGCSKVSPGCDNCYAETFAERWRGTPGHYFEGGFDVQLRPDKLDMPLRWTKPRRIFVNSMSDLFHESVPDRFIGQVFEVMGAAKQHTFQLLTKRHGRMRSLLNRWSEHATKGCYCPAGEGGCSAPVDVQNGVWPLPNVWVGVSVEDQKWSDIRIPALLDTPAAVRFLSCEPLLGPVDLWGPLVHPGHRPRLTYWLDGRPGWGPEETSESGLVTQPLAVGPRIDWVIVGGESGPGARPMHPDWVRTIRDQCVHSGVAFHFKQWGAWAPTRFVGIGNQGPQYAYVGEPVDKNGHRAVMERVGKKAAGRELDGREWNEFPDTKPLEVAARG